MRSVVLLIALAAVGEARLGVKPAFLQKEAKPKYAYITMFLVKDQNSQINLIAPDKEGPEAVSFLQQMDGGVPARPRDKFPDSVLDLADNLKEVGAKYPLVVLTNSDMLLMKNITDFYPNLVPVPITEPQRLKMQCEIKKSHDTHFQKLMIFDQTQYKKLVWMDIDIALTKNIDDIFEKDTSGSSQVWGQVDDYQCDGVPSKSSTAGGFCSALMVFQPSKSTFDGLMAEQKKMNYCWGDQSIIHQYFSKGGRKTNLLDRSVIDYEHCNKKAAALHFSGSPKAKRHAKVRARHLPPLV
jgi:hypothetical protein